MRAKTFRLRHRRLTMALCLLAWMAAFIVTHIPGNEVPEMHMTDKTMHTVGYAGLASLLWLTLWTYWHPAVRRIMFCITILPMYGVFDEMTQPFFGRSCDVNDWMFDCLGIALAVVFWELAACAVRPHVPHTPEHNHHLGIPSLN